MIANAEEISRAIEAIPPQELVRLTVYAENRLARIGAISANGRTEDDLLQEAVVRLLDGTRRWDPAKVSIVNGLLGTMRSIASAWAAYQKRNRLSPEFALTESALTPTSDTGEVDSPLSAVPNGLPNAEDLAIAEALNAVKRAFADEVGRP